jgi:Zn-dependent protease with chaperone function
VYKSLGICLILTALLAVNTLASLFMAAGWRVCEQRLRNISARARAEILFAMRVGPAALAAICVGFLLVPAYVGYEPYGTTEVVSRKLAGLALLSAAGLAFAWWRTCRSWLATRALLREWLSEAQQISLDGADIRAYRLQHAFPIIAVVGTLRPRLFLAEQVLETLTEEELTAAIAHEHGHLAARDNLKRSVLHACRNALMIFPFGRSLDRAWAEAAESAADEHAARANPERALNLASALVKIARMVPVGASANVPLAAYLVGAEQTHGVKDRVKRLIEIASGDLGEPRDNSMIARILPIASFAGFAVVAGAVATNPGVLLAVHGAIERVVNLLC